MRVYGLATSDSLDMSGKLTKGKPIGISAGPGEPVKAVKTSEVFVFDGMGRASVEEATAGDIVVFAGIPEFNIGDTLVDPTDPKPLTPQEQNTVLSPLVKPSKTRRR